MSLEPGDRSYSVELPMRILFVENRPGGAVVDGVSTGPSPLRDGTPISLDAVLPPALWSFAAAYALGCWAAQGAEVTVRLQRRRSELQARIDGPPFTVLLDLRRLPAGLVHPAVPWTPGEPAGQPAAL